MNHSYPHVVGPQAAESKQQFDPWLLWVTLRRCWHWAVPVGLVLGCLGGLVVLKSFVPKYRSSHLLEANDEFILYKNVMPTFSDLAQTEKTILFNNLVLDSVIQDPSLRGSSSLRNPDQAEQQLRANLKVTGAGSRQRMLVTYTDTDREYAALVCNAVVSSYLRVRADSDQARVNKLESLLIPEIDHWRQEVEKLQANYTELNKVVGAPIGPISTESSQTQVMTRVQQLRNKIGELEVDIKMERLKLEVVQQEHTLDAGIEGEAAADFAEFVPPIPNFTRGEVDYDGINRRVEEDNVVVKAAGEVQRYQQLVQRMEDLGTNRLYQAEYREKLRKLSQAQETLKQQRDELRDSLIAKSEKALDEQYDALRKKAAEDEAMLRARFEAETERKRVARELQLKAEQRDLERSLIAVIDDKSNQVALLQEQLGTEVAKQERLSATATKLQFTEDEMNRARGILEQLEDRQAAIRTERRQLVAVRSLAPATPPRMPIESMPFKQLVLASGLGFAIPFLLGLAWEMRTNRVTDSLTLDRYTGLAPVVGELAKSPTAGSSRGSKGRRVFQESVDTLRANLFLSKDTRESRSIAIVSSMSGEGKSTTASQLAISLAKASGKTVLLVDGDMRCPDQHDVFGLPLGPGLSGVLSDEATLDDAICTELGDLIHVLPAGRLKASPHRLMSPAAMKELVEQALEKYEFVIFDTAPVLSAGETLAVAAAVDSTLVCAMRDVTRMDSVVRTTHRLESAGANVAGTVFNGVTPRQYAYRYGDYNYSNFVEFAEASREG